MAMAREEEEEEEEEEAARGAIYAKLRENY
jgi:hypothetical protein